jgi:fatty acid desaturase
MRAFRVAWNLLFGIPTLAPSFFYENHIDHHNSRHYGTLRDGEYLPLGAGPLAGILLFYAQVPLLPIYIFLRFLFSPITFLHPKLRNWVLEHMSSFVINFRHRLAIRKTAPRWIWAMLEVACFLRAVLLVGVVAVGAYSWTRLVQFYCLSVFVLGLNYIRNLVAHHYRNTGGEMSHLAQLEDSVNITGHWFWTELFFPLGLRYHALHHLFPGLPYHNLGRAHRRLMAQLPADSPYRQTVYTSFWAVVRELLDDVKAASRQHTPARV